jgi:hypothetical protein
VYTRELGEYKGDHDPCDWFLSTCVSSFIVACWCRRNLACLEAAAALPARAPSQEGTKQPWKPQGSA